MRMWVELFTKSRARGECMNGRRSAHVVLCWGYRMEEANYGAGLGDITC
jgi:hypothetical protein